MILYMNGKKVATLNNKIMDSVYEMIQQDIININIIQIVSKVVVFVTTRKKK